MKIAMVGQFPPHIGGVGVHINSLAHELVKRGHTVYVITYPHKDIKDIDGIHVIGTKGVNIPGLRGLGFYFNAKKELKKLCEKENIDIIHGHYLVPAGLVAVEVGEKLNIKTYVTAHGSDIFELYNKKPYTHHIIKKVLKKADIVLAVSHALYDNILKIDVNGLSKKLRLYQNSVDISKFNQENNYDFKKELKEEYNLNNDYPILVFVGNLIPRKNVNSIIEAKKIAKTNYNLVIVGDGPEKDNLKKLAENVDNIYFTGARRDVEKILPNCDTLILPSHTESFGLVLIEALACGCSVIGSNVGGIKEIITDDVGVLVNPEDIKSISNGIDKIFSDNKLLNKFKSNARSRACDFSEVEIPYDELK
ncbi:glycosyl transferase family 1 [Methanobrevibacter sp. 87.7]|uniref:glycosyltransferase family 4 protein n=1 Tax=Methanobrevibacter sp. 87.7 TaxID=387957 RepID=UPI000B50EC99|nr:glycosyltransferase family 4 protein [Methanobrevibacter sp. 87.7]OWT33254.1 glycosyl transferase family 1 [Methanobrevibacter sp. 87.7]